MADYKNILVPIDFSSSAEQVINRALDIARRNNARLNLLHVVEYLPPIDIAYEPAASVGWDVNEADMKAQAEKNLLRFSDQFGVPDSIQQVVIGTPKQEISQYAQDHECDLIVMGAHGRHGIGRLLGSTANGVLHDMPCDVMAIKISDEK